MQKMLKETAPILRYYPSGVKMGEDHPHMWWICTHHIKQTAEGLHCTDSSSGTLHSTESCLHPYIPAQTGGTEEKENIWVCFLSLMVQWARFVAVVGLKALWSLMQKCSQGMNTHTRAHTYTHTLSLSFNAGGDPQLTGGPCLELEPTTPEAEANQRNMVGRGRRERADQIGKT